MNAKSLVLLATFAVIVKQCTSGPAVGEWRGLLNNVTRCAEYPDTEGYIIINLVKKGRTGRQVVRTEVNLPKGLGNEFTASIQINKIDKTGKTNKVASHDVGPACKATNEYFGQTFKELLDYLLSFPYQEQEDGSFCLSSGQGVSAEVADVAPLEMQIMPKNFYGRYLTDMYAYDKSGSLYFCCNTDIDVVPKNSVKPRRT